MFMWLQNLGIGKKLILSMTLLLIVTFGIAGELIYKSMFANLEKEVSASFRNTASNGAIMIANEIGALMAKTEGIAVREDIQSMNWSVQSAVLQKELQRIGNTRFGVTDLKGKCFYTDGSVRNLADRDYFRKATQQGITSICDPLVSKVDKKVVVVVAAPIRNRLGQIQGMLQTTFNWFAIGQMIKNIQVADGQGYPFIINRAGYTIAHPQTGLVLKGFNALASVKKDPTLRSLVTLEKKMVKGESGSGSYTYNKRDWFMAYAPIPGSNWSLAVTAPKRLIFQSINQLRVYLLALLLIILVIVTFLIAFLTKRLISRPIQQLVASADRLARGDISVTVRAGSHDELGSLSQSFNKMIANIREQAKIAERIAAGDLAVEIRPRSDEDIQVHSMKQMVESLRELLAELNRLTGAAVAGELSARGDNAKFQGAFGEIVQGINRTLDAVVGPLNIAANYVERIGDGEIPPLITEEYQGQYEKLKNSINACIKGLGALTESDAVLQRMARNDYTQRITGDYHGVYGEIAQAVNEVFDNLLNIQRVTLALSHGDFSHLEDLKRTGRLSENDELIPAYLQMMETVLAMVAESVRLAEAATAGQLDTRGDADRFAGEFRQVIAGFNATLDAVILPLNEAGTVLGKIAVNDYTQEMSGAYQGVLKDLADQINMTRLRLLSVQDTFIRLAKGDISRLEEFHRIGKRSENDQMMPSATAMMEAIVGLLDESKMLAAAAFEGRLEVRGNAEKFAGKYREIIAGLNQALDAMVQPIHRASDVLHQMAQGNLADGMTGEYRGEYARIQAALNDALDSFNQILGEINNAAGQVAAAARQVSGGSQALSQGATEQAATVEELSAAITEIAAQTKQNALRADQVHELADLAQNSATEGNEQMAAMLAAMGAIDEAATSIAKIIQVIDEIAFQTNILALNAAVEAARAGQHGKGFAVVAEEVRNLAGRSAKAARETAELIEGSLRKVADGTRLANQTATSLNKIVTGVAQTADLAGEIAVASNEQATGIAQIDQGINQVSQVIQTTTATSEESASASEELSSQAEHLKEMVGRFKLRHQAAETAPDQEEKNRFTAPARIGIIGFGKY